MEQARCLLCGNNEAQRQSAVETPTICECPACKYYTVDSLFVKIASDHKVPDAYVLSGYSRQLSDAGQGMPQFTYHEHIFEAGKRLERGEPAHSKLMEHVPQTRDDTTMRILQEVERRSADVEYGQMIDFVPQVEFTLCYAKNFLEFRDILKRTEARGGLSDSRPTILTLSC